MRGTKSKKVSTGKVVAITIMVTVTALIVIYIGGWVKTVGKFLPNTYIDNVDVSGMSLSDAIKTLEEVKNVPKLSIRENNDEITRIPASDFDYFIDIKPSVKDIYMAIDYSEWFKAYFKETYHELDVQPTYDSEKLRNIVKAQSWGETESADAKIIRNENGFKIQGEVYGDKLDSAEVAEFVVQQFEQGTFEVDLKGTDLYKQPAVKAVDLYDKLNELNTYYNFVITYDFNYTQETLNGADVYEWVDETGNVDRAKVENYVASLADKYDTFKTTRQFETTNRGVVSIDQGRYSMGQYGWWIDQEKTVNKLLKYIENGESITVEPEYVVLSDSGYTYKGFATGRSAEGDVGDTYIEVDLTNQHLWYYCKGELLFETDQIVTGKASDPDRKTPYGMFSVYSKSTDYTMKTPEYSTKCAYFMRISFEGVGFHDYNRPAYGGDIYLNNGSHGCINMKLEEVSQLYELVELGTPVVMYY